MDHELPPPARMLHLITGFFVTQAVYAAAKLGIADLLKAGPKDADELAKATGAHAPSLYRILRALASVGVFSEDAQKRFSSTPVGECLQAGKMKEFAVFMGEPWHWRVYEETLHSVMTGKQAFDKVYGVPPFEWLTKNPGPAASFDAAMTSFTTSIIPAIIEAAPLQGIRTLIDVGGGHGALIRAILKANPSMNGAVYDMPSVVAGAKGPIAADKLEGRCRAEGGDFFASVPAADAYILKHIIHDWNDERARTILRNCRKSLAPGGRVLLVEGVVPPGDAPSFDKLLDLEMLLIPGGKERTEAEFRALFESADLRLTRVIPTRSPVFILEAMA